MRIVNVKAEQESVKFEDLDEGQCFKWGKDDDEVYLKTDYEQDAVNLETGEYFSNLCGEDVFPVDAEVHVIE